MATEYTDVDRLILSRWTDVMGLFEAHEELQDRIEEVIDHVVERLDPWMEERGYDITCDARSASVYFGKPEWHHKRKDDWIVYFEIGAIAPLGFRKVREHHPYAWVITKNLEFVRMKEAERIEFAKSLREELGDIATKWTDNAADEANSPLGRYLKHIADADRVELITETAKLETFLKTTAEELFELSDPLDRTLARFRSKE